MSDSPGTLVGNLTRDPELRFTTGGSGVLSGGLAVNKRKQVNGEWQEETSFFNFVAFGTLGENMAASLSKGQRVVLVGHWEARPYETKEGDKRTSTEFVVDAGGPDLRWAKAQVTKVEKAEGGNSSRGSSRRQSADPIYGDEEPF